MCYHRSLFKRKVSSSTSNVVIFLNLFFMEVQLNYSVVFNVAIHAILRALGEEMVSLKWPFSWFQNHSY